MSKIRCRIRENAKFLDGIRDLTATREGEFPKIWARDAGFFACLSGIREIVTTQENVLPPNRINQASAKYQSKGPIYILNLLAFAEISLFWCISGKEKTVFGIVMKKCGMQDSREKGAGMRDQDLPFQTPIICCVILSFGRWGGESFPINWQLAGI